MQVDYDTVIKSSEISIIRKNQDRIRKELDIKDAYDQPYFSKEIVDHAHYIYSNKMKNIGSYRKIKRLQLCYILIVYACEELGITYDTNYIRTCFRLSPQECQRTYIDFSPMQTGYTEKTKKLDYLYYLNVYIQKLAINADLTLLIKHIEDKCDILRRNDNAQYYSAALLALYLKINNAILQTPLVEILNLQLEEFERCCRRVEFVYFNSMETIASKLKCIKINS